MLNVIDILKVSRGVLRITEDYIPSLRQHLINNNHKFFFISVSIHHNKLTYLPLLEINNNARSMASPL